MPLFNISLFHDTENAAIVIRIANNPTFACRIRKHCCRDYKIGVLGTLAAMGHKDVLPELRKLAIEGDALDRSRAIEWLGFCKDAGFITELTAMLDDREPWIREAAEKALAAIGSVPTDEVKAVIPPIPADSASRSKLPAT